MNVSKEVKQGVYVLLVRPIPLPQLFISGKPMENRTDDVARDVRWLADTRLL